MKLLTSSLYITNLVTGLCERAPAAARRTPLRRASPVRRPRRPKWALEAGEADETHLAALFGRPAPVTVRGVAGSSSERVRIGSVTFE